ncbi:MAG: bifunctional UDP-N-acetylglucosamine diphosphorylase/glucosamine-1-phosphate N-acetyltransferase GlmU [Xanthomonadaceae bacterium]|nr:bifunctional UDP-N-acetylglucosamine diphosphorylase/glucosamine-1-phosphate N-acetyltransferase GlmU [Xanthomonadaceae bacterium]
MSFNAIILAAGQGKRMHSDLPKVCHEVMGRPMVLHVYHQLKKADPSASICVVIGHGREEVKKCFKGLDVSFAVQEQQLGTGHAVQQALNSPWGGKIGKAPVLVLSGDTPLITSEAIQAIAGEKLGKTVVRMLTTHLDNPTGYGRVIRKGKSVKAVVEQKDASPAQQKIREVNTGVYLFDSAFLRANINLINNRNSQSEFYLPDVLGIAVKKQKPVEGVIYSESRDLSGVNNPWELSLANQVMAGRINRGHAMNGVFFIDPGEVWIDIDVEIASGTKIEPNVILRGKTVIGSRVHLKAGTIIADSRVDSDASLGPYAHIRPESHVGKGAKIGNFVELKKARIGEKTAISHLSYIGDAIVGSLVNIGCGFVTCNYDGKSKHQTIIEDEVFMGSDCQVIAPLKVGLGAYVASGSTLTKDVPAGSLAIARTRQENKLDYAKKFKKGS